MAALETVECSTHIINVLNHSLDASASLESLSNVWDRQAHLLDGCRVNGTSVESIGRPIYSTAVELTYFPHKTTSE